MAKPVKTKAMTVNVTGIDEAEKLLAKMPLELREKQLRGAVRVALNIVKREAVRLCPKPGYPGDLPGKLPLNKSISTKTIGYQNVVLGMVGPRRPEGAHGHLVEFGHRIVRKHPGPAFTRPRPFLRPAADTTKRQQEKRIVEYLKKKLTQLV